MSYNIAKITSRKKPVLNRKSFLIHVLFVLIEIGIKTFHIPPDGVYFANHSA